MPTDKLSEIRALVVYLQYQKARERGNTEEVGRLLELLENNYDSKEGDQDE